MSKVEIVYNSDGDWVAVFVDGVWFDDGHEVNYDRLLDKLGIPVKEYEVEDDEFFDDSVDGLTDELRSQLIDTADDED